VPLTDHVVHVTPRLFGERGVFGGAERYSYELARHMSRYTATTLVTFGNESRTFVTDEGLGVQVWGPAWRVRGQEFNPLHIGIVNSLRHAGIVHCHQPHTLVSELCALLARAARKRVFASDLGGGGWGFSGRLNTDKWFHGHLHISEYSRISAGHVRRTGATVVYGGVDTDLFRPAPSVNKEKLIVFVGRLLPHKGVDYLIDALPPGLTLEVIGQPYDAQYVTALTRAAAGKAVVFRHDCNDDQLVRAYQRARAVVLPSVYTASNGSHTKAPELLGQTLLEGMACGTCGICTDVGSMPEVVVDGETGFVVPPNDSGALRERLEWLRDHPLEAFALGGAARERVVKHFTWASVVQRCFDAYAGRASCVS
jgi:glycosyltransferase involved in cell wall biosynthesis